MMSPPGALITPWLSTAEPISMTRPPGAAVMLPWLMTGAANARSAAKRMRPARKSSLVIFSVEATSPATSTRALAPKNMPFGLMRKTRPFDCRVPRMTDGSTPVTRLSTVLAADCWMKRVVSAAPIENCCQLMIAPGVLMTDSTLP